MSGINCASENLVVLFPPFKQILTLALSEANERLVNPSGSLKFAGVKRFVLAEGYRSVQANGSDKLAIEWTKYPELQSYGLVAKIAWLDSRGESHYDGPDALWEILGLAADYYGLEWGGKYTIREMNRIQPSPCMLDAWSFPARQFIRDNVKNSVDNESYKLAS